MIDSFSGKYRFLSNFWPCTVTLDEKIYYSVEHAYQAAKTLDVKLRRPFQWRELTAGEAKALGKILPIRRDWNLVRNTIMRSLVEMKFASPALAELLQATGDAELVEGNTWGDDYWGKCRGFGQNRLGIMLMEIRAAKAAV